MTNNDGMSAQAIAAGKGFSSMMDVLSGTTATTRPSDQTAEPSPATPPVQEVEEEVVEEEVEEVEEDISPEISEVLEFLTPREVNQLIALKKEFDESKRQMSESEAEFKSKIKTKETSLNDIHTQLDQAQKLEESLKKDLRKVSKDIDVLQRQDLDIREEVNLREDIIAFMFLQGGDGGSL